MLLLWCSTSMKVFHTLLYFIQLSMCIMYSKSYHFQPLRNLKYSSIKCMALILSFPHCVFLLELKDRMQSFAAALSLSFSWGLRWAFGSIKNSSMDSFVWTGTENTCCLRSQVAKLWDIQDGRDHGFILRVTTLQASRTMRLKRKDSKT